MNTLTKTSIELNPALKYYTELTSAHSQRTMMSALNTSAKILTNNEAATLHDVAWHTLTHIQVSAVKKYLTDQHKAPTTINKHLAALRRVSKEAYDLELMSEKVYRLISQVKDVKGTRVLKGRDIPYTEMKALTDATKADTNKNKSARDLAILALLYGAGMRREEIAKLTPKDYAQGKLSFIGKGNNGREIFIAGKVREYLEAWIAVRGDIDGLLFCAVLKSGKLKATHSVASVAQTIYNVLTERASDAGIEGEFARPHDFRRTFIGDQLDAGTDIVTVGAIVGQQDPRTTAKYDRRGNRTKQEAAIKVKMP